LIGQNQGAFLRKIIIHAMILIRAPAETGQMSNAGAVGISKGEEKGSNLF
jgi:hypothetical protein